MTARQLHQVTPLWPGFEPNPADHEPWMDLGVCAETDPDSFFPEKGQPTMPAKKVCARCPVAAECLEYALREDIRFGVWGGMSEKQRIEIRKQRGQEAA